MSWLGGSISSLTGQLSNLTKDILSEGTEEIDDPTTELRLAKEKLEQLDSLLSSQRQENERLKRLNKELEEKAEGSELQINAISREYRGVLESKEKEVNALKQQHQELLEQHARSAALSVPSREGVLSLTSSSSSSVPHDSDHSQSWAYPAEGGDKFASYSFDGDHGAWDFDDSIRLQKENNNLRADLQKLQSEVKHWRSVAGQLGHNVGQNSDQQVQSADVLDLQHKVKSLETQLAKKQDEMQQQATSLHEHHRQKVSNLKSNHKAEIDLIKSSHKADINTLREQLEALEIQVAGVHDRDISSEHNDADRLSELDQSESRQRELELQRRLEEALSEKEKFQNACSHLEHLVEELQGNAEQLQQHQTVTGDEVLQRKITELTHNLQESEALRLGLEREIEEVRQDLVATKYRLLDQLDANHADAQEVLSELRELRENMSTETAFRRNEMRAERRTLVNQLFRVGQQKNQLTQSLQSVKKEQEIVLAETEAAIEKIGDRGLEYETTAELFNTLEKENLLLKEQKLKLEEQLSLLEKAASTCTAEKQALVNKVKLLRSQLQEVKGEEDNYTSDTDDLDLVSEDSLDASDSKSKALNIHNEDVEKELALLRAQLAVQTRDESDLEMERADWLLEREALEDVVTDLRKQSQEQAEEIRSLKSEKVSVLNQGSEHSEDGDSSEKLQVLEAEISVLREEKVELENALEELDTQHCQAQEQLIKQRDHLMSQLAERSAQIQQQQEEIENLNNIITKFRELEETEQLNIDGGEHLHQQQLIWEEKCRQLEAELTEAKSYKVSYSAMEKEIADLKEKLQKGGIVINDLHMDKQELEIDLKSAKEEIAAKVAKLKELRETNASLVKEKKTLEEKNLEMEDRLLEMEEEVERWQQVNEDTRVQQMNALKEHKEVQKLKSQVAAMEQDKLTFSASFNSLSSNQPSSQFSFEDAAFSKILEEEAKVRKKFEDDSYVIQELRGEVKKLYESKQLLKREVHELRSSQEACIPKITQLENDLRDSRALIASADEAKSALEKKLEMAYENVELLKANLSAANVKLEELSKQNKELSSKLFVFEAKQSEQIGHNETNSETEFKSGQQSDVESQLIQNQKLLDSQREMIDSLQAEVQLKAKLHVMLEAKNEEVQELNNKLTSVEQELSLAQAQISNLESLCMKKDKEISELTSKLGHFDKDFLDTISATEKGQKQSDFESVSKNQNASSQQQNDKNTINTADDCNKLKREIERLKIEASESQRLLETVDQLEAELTACNDRLTELHQELAHANEIIRRQQAGIADLNDKIDVQRHQLQQAETDSELQKSTIAVLQQTSIDKEACLNEIETKMNFLMTLLTDQQKEYLKHYSTVPSNIPALEYKQVPAIEFLHDSSINSSITEHSRDMQPVAQSVINKKVDLEINGSVTDGDLDNITSDFNQVGDLEKEVGELKDRLKEKDVIIAELQRSNSFSLAFLEKGGSVLEKSLSSQMSIHKMEVELSSLRAEKEQMVAVVTDKSRENSSLKSELHRLMDVVSASQAAIDKLQQDNRNLEHRKHSPPREDGEDDMRREALTNMARLVRDRETEIEALKQKNETLLAVLHESGDSQAAAHLAPLLQDKEILMQQNAALTSEREQLIACINQKHSESLAYHAEVQRLTQILVESQAASEKVKNDYAALILTFEDKSQALLAAQNELIRYKQKLTDLEVRHGELIQRSSSHDSLNSPELSSLENDLERLRHTESDLRITLTQQEEKVHMLNHRNSTLEENLTAKDAECALLKKQMENSKFQIAGLMAEIYDLKAEREQIVQKFNVQNTECANLRESHDRMSLEVRDKNMEVSSLKEQATTLTSLLNEQQGEHGQVTQLMKENEATMATARLLQQERDQQTMIAEQKSQECNVLRNEMAYMKEKELRLTKELERLRAHLLEIEEGFTKDALEAEEREKDLRNKLAVAEEHLMSSSLQVESASKESRRQVESIQQQLHHVASQRDSAYMQVANIQEQCQQYATSLSNLQLVLEHFQKEKDSAIAMETEHLQNECKVLRIELKEVQAELQATRGDLTEALDGLEAANRLSEQLDRKEEALAALKEEVQLREQALNEAEEEIRRLNSSTEAKVDKTLMHNVVMTWLLSPENKQMEIIHLMGNILSFSQEDFEKIENAHRKGGLLSGLFRRTSTTPASPASRTPTRQSFSQLFVKFLEEESSPLPTPVRLPAEAMAAEMQHRHRPTFNPFMAPRHVTQDGYRASTPSSHLLMSPDSPTSTPLFSPLTSTPSSAESAILKDVLGNR